MRILIADDYYTNRLLVSEIVKSLGHTSFEAENGLQVLDILEKHPDIDLILMDIEMPVMNGIETVKHIRDKFMYPRNSIPVVAITAHNPDVYSGDLTDHGFNRLLIKPFSIDKVAEVLSYFISKG